MSDAAWWVNCKHVPLSDRVYKASIPYLIREYALATNGNAEAMTATFLSLYPRDEFDRLEDMFSAIEGLGDE